MNMLSKTSKMPCYSTSHNNCGIGSKLKRIPGSVCQKCYKDKGFYCIPRNRQLLIDKSTMIDNNLEEYKQALIEAIQAKVKNGYFRFHDAGDIVSYDHLQVIFDICRHFPGIKFWIPTKAIDILRRYLKQGNKIPKNAIIRISSFMLNKKIKLYGALKRFPIASVFNHDHYRGFTCITNDKGNCGKCRACWDKKVKHIVYKLH